MSRIRVLIAVLLLVSVAWGPQPIHGDVSSPTIDRVEPNPVSDRNVGEYVVLSLDVPQNLAGWTLTDGRATAALPNETVEGRIALSQQPRSAMLLTELPVYGWHGHLPLSADGDTIELRSPDGAVVDTFSYERTRNGEGWKRDEDGEIVRVRYTTDVVQPAPRPVDEGTAFVLPDEPQPVIQTLDTAEDRIWLAGYELTDPLVVERLIERHEAGVDVRVLIDGNPVGGQSDHEIVALDRLAMAGIPVDVLTGERRRFRFHHPKYAIADDTVVVMSENWKPAGTGGASSRGWGVAIDDPELATDLAKVFRVDSTARDRVQWSPTVDPGTALTVDPPPPLVVDHHPAEAVDVATAELGVAPANAKDRVLEEIESAESRIDVQQVRISDSEFPLLVALVEAAREGVSVRIHLDSTWYVAEDNAALVAHLESLAADEDLDLEIAKADPADRYEKVHNKGVIVDGDTVILGSMNWNNVSMLDNREVILILKGDEVGAYYTEVFEGDWAPPGQQTPIGFIAFVLSIWLGVGIFAYRRIGCDTD